MFLMNALAAGAYAGDCRPDSISAAKQEQYLKRLEGELVRMDTLVGELLTLSRLETSNIPLEKKTSNSFLS